MRIAACFLLATALIAGAFAQEFKGVTYKKPAGWDEAVEGDAKVFAPKGLKEGDLLAIIMTGAVPSNGSSWEKQFTDTIELANDGGKAANVSKVEKRENKGVELMIQTLDLDHKEVGEHSRLYAQVSFGQQRVFVTVILNKEALMEKYADAIMEFIGSLGFKSAPAPAAPKPAPASPAKGKIPTGNTPNNYSGTPGWLPSGNGVPIPAPAIANGKPIGLWNKWTYDASAKRMKTEVRIFLADGTRATHPRLGGGMLYDLAGQRAQRGATGVGTFAISGGQIVERYDGFENRAAFSTGKDTTSQYFMIGGAKFRPVLAPAARSIVGQWKGQGVEYKFKADGTFETGMTHANGDWAVAGFDTGTYVLEGHLIQLIHKKAASYITFIGWSGDSLIIGDELYSKR